MRVACLFPLLQTQRGLISTVLNLNLKLFVSQLRYAYQYDLYAAAGEKWKIIEKQDCALLRFDVLGEAIDRSTDEFAEGSGDLAEFVDQAISSCSIF